MATSLNADTAVNDDKKYIFIGDIHGDIFALLHNILNICHINSNIPIIDNIINNYTHNIKYRIRRHRNVHGHRILEYSCNLNDLYDIIVNDNRLYQEIYNYMNTNNIYIYILGDAFDMNQNIDCAHYIIDIIEILYNEYHNLPRDRRNVLMDYLNGFLLHDNYNNRLRFNLFLNAGVNRNDLFEGNTLNFGMDGNIIDYCHNHPDLRMIPDVIINHMKYYVYNICYLTYIFMLKLKDQVGNRLIYIFGNHDIRENFFTNIVNPIDRRIMVNGNNINNDCYNNVCNMFNYDPINVHINVGVAIPVDFQHPQLLNESTIACFQTHGELFYASHAGVLTIEDNVGNNTLCYSNKLIDNIKNILIANNDPNPRAVLNGFDQQIFTQIYNNSAHVMLTQQIIGHTYTLNLNARTFHRDALRNLFNHNDIIVFSDQINTLYNIYRNDNNNIYYYSLRTDENLYKYDNNGRNPETILQPFYMMHGGKEFKINQELINDHIKNIKDFIEKNIKLINLMSIINYDMFIYLLANVYFNYDVTKNLLDKNTRNQQLIQLYLSLYPTSKKQLSNNKELKQIYGGMIGAYYNNEDLFNLEKFVNFIVRIKNIELNEEDKKMIKALINELDGMKEKDLLKIFDN